MILSGLAMTACGRGLPNPVSAGSAPSSPDTASPGPSTSAVSSDRPIAPLTGLPVASPADAARPAVALDVAGPDPRGLSSADVVFEEITSPVRYIAVYQSRQAAGVGPITATAFVATIDTIVLCQAPGPDEDHRCRRIPLPFAVQVHRGGTRHVDAGRLAGGRRRRGTAAAAPLPGRGPGREHPGRPG